MYIKKYQFRKQTLHSDQLTSQVPLPPGGRLTSGIMAPSAIASSNFLLFTDQSQDPATFLKSILQDAHHAKLLFPFLQASTSALKHETRLLLPTEQKFLASLDSISGLIAQAHVEEKNVITSTVLLCMAQLCSLQMLVMWRRIHVTRQTDRSSQLLEAKSQFAS